MCAYLTLATYIGQIHAPLSSRRILTGFLAIFFSLGAAWYCFRCRWTPPDGIRVSRDDAPILTLVRGAIVGIPNTYPGDRPDPWEEEPAVLRARPPWSSFTLRLTEVFVNNRWRPTSGALIVGAEGVGADHLARCGRVEITGFLEPVSKSRNPHDSIPQAELRGVSGKLATSCPENIVPLRNGPVSFLKTLAARLAARFETIIDRNLSGDDADMAVALLLGRRQRLSPQVYADFLDTGTVHILAISGFHVFAVCLQVGILLRLIGLRQPWRAIFLICFVWAYSLLTGMNPPVLRASVMITLLIAAPLLGRRNDSPSALAAAVLVILIVSPSELFMPGFQLSVAAVAGLIWLSARVHAALWPWDALIRELQSPEERVIAARWRYSAHRAVALTLGAWAATAPIVVHHFGLIAPSGLFLNLLILLPLSWYLAVGLLLCLFGTIGPIGWTLAALMKLTGIMFAAPVRFAADAFSAMSVPQVPLAWTIGFMFLICLWTIRRRIGIRLAPLTMAALALTAVPFASQSFRGIRNPAYVDFLDIGHGLCSILRTSDDRIIMFDAGSLSPTADRDILAPHLRSEGISRIDALFISHEHVDHWNMVALLLRRARIGTVVVSRNLKETAAGKWMLSELLRHAERVVEVEAGNMLKLGGETEIAILSPPRAWEFQPEDGNSANEDSIVALARTGESTILFSGDADRSALAPLLFSLVNSGAASRENGTAAKRIDLLQLPHHGHPSPASRALLATARPRMAVASNGLSRRPAGTPSHDEYTMIVETSRCGFIRVLPGANSRVDTFIEGGLRPR